MKSRPLRSPKGIDAADLVPKLVAVGLLAATGIEDLPSEGAAYAAAERAFRVAFVMESTERVGRHVHGDEVEGPHVQSALTVRQEKMVA